jgi:hypothetical protein
MFVFLLVSSFLFVSIILSFSFRFTLNTFRRERSDKCENWNVQTESKKKEIFMAHHAPVPLKFSSVTHQNFFRFLQSRHLSPNRVGSSIATQEKKSEIKVDFFRFSHAHASVHVMFFLLSNFSFLFCCARLTLLFFSCRLSRV